MELIANISNRKILKTILPPSDVEIDGVMAAIAYGSNFTDEKNDFIGHCLENRYRLDIWMRYDHTVPVAVTLLKRLLKHHKDNIFCKLIPDCMHSKVIWWKGYGAYIGSANLTDRSWVTNIEAGIFLTDVDLQKDGMQIAIENFFEYLENLPQAFPLDEKIIRELEKIDAARKGVRDIGKELRSVPVWGGPAFEFDEERKATYRRKEAFRKEWHETLTDLSKIGEQLAVRRPVWISENVPIAWQIDQFLHAYYYNRLGDSRGRPFEDYFNKNRSDPNFAVSTELKWWEDTPSAPSNENDNLYVRAPYIREHLSKEKLLTLSEQEFANVCGNTHATSDHIKKMGLATLGRPDLHTLPRDERILLYAAWLLRQRNAKDWNVLQLLHYVLYGGNKDDLWERIYTATRDREYSLPHYGLNSVAELAGWARPDIAIPRNGRTSKALRALGFTVKIY